ncbi:MAG: CDP-alcohol phosphatidyltransferase family protein [Candidatus Latescibacteria bacterium]|nr:CDP-alcohol phosphatidyltransferase family protein [Candidatus Latescibacterota bacterium]
MERIEKSIMPDQSVRIRRGQWFTIANGLSALRICCLPFILYFLYHTDRYGDWPVLTFMLVAALSDVLDGYFARVRHNDSELGRLLDPIADKITIAGIVLFLVWLRDFPLWAAVFIWARDIAIALGGLSLLHSKHIILPSSNLSRYAVLIIVLAIGAFTFQLDRVKWVLLYSGMGLLLLAVVIYASYFFRLFRKPKG